MENKTEGKKVKVKLLSPNIQLPDQELKLDTDMTVTQLKELINTLKSEELSVSLSFSSSIPSLSFCFRTLGYCMEEKFSRITTNSETIWRPLPTWGRETCSPSTCPAPSPANITAIQRAGDQRRSRGLSQGLEITLTGNPCTATTMAKWARSICMAQTITRFDVSLGHLLS